MKNKYSITISNRLVEFDVSKGWETIQPGTCTEDLNTIYENEDYKLLHDFKMAYSSKKVLESERDYKAINYINLYDDILSKIRKRFPDFEFDLPE